MTRKQHYPPGTPEREIAIRRRVHRIAEFYRHAMVYVIVISLLWLINALLIARHVEPGADLGQILTVLQQAKWKAWWAIWTTAGWGIGLIAHGITVLPLGGFFAEDWEEKKVKELMAREDR